MIYLKFSKKAFEYHTEKVQKIFDEVLRKFDLFPKNRIN